MTHTPVYFQLADRKTTKKRDYSTMMHDEVSDPKIKLVNTHGFKIPETHCCLLKPFHSPQSREPVIEVLAVGYKIAKTEAHKKYREACKAYYFTRLPWKYDLLKEVMNLDDNAGDLAGISWPTNLS